MSEGGGEGNRDRFKAVLLSALACPGAGQVYKRQYARGVVLILLSLAVIAAVFVKTAASTMDIMANTPPDVILMDVFGIAHRIMEKDASFFAAAGYILLAVWVYGMLDAALTKARPGGRDSVA